MISMTDSKGNEEMINTTPKWYIVQTYIGFEDAVKRLLDQKIENLSLQDKILEIYVPTKKVLKLTSKGERQEKEEKVYPGYIYLHMILDKETGYIIQNTQYVSRIAGTGEAAVPLEDGYVDMLKKDLLAQGKNVGVKTNVTYKIGDLIKVMDGPFQDMQGKISGIDQANNRVTVLLTIFERETEVDVDVLEIQKAVG